MSPIHSHRSLWETVHTNELEVERPDAIVLGEGESPEGAVKSATCAGDFALVHQKLAVVQPDTRHLCVCVGGGGEGGGGGGVVDVVCVRMCVCVCACVCVCVCVCVRACVVCVHRGERERDMTMHGSTLLLCTQLAYM